MPVLYRASFVYLARHPWQLGLALLGICMGVAVMVGIDTANESSRRAFFMSMDTINGAATHQVVAGPGGVSESVYTDLRVNRGIREIAPIVAGYVQIDATMLQAFGVDIFAEREFRSYTSTANISRNVVAPDSGLEGASAELVIGKLLTIPGAVVMAAGTAANLGLSIDDSFSLVVNGRERNANLVGFFGSSDDVGLQNLVITDIAVLQNWLGMSGRLSRIDVKISDAGVKSDIEDRLPSGTILLTAEGRTQSTAAMSDAFTTNLSAMSLLALLVGVFLIYNSVAFAVLQRRGLIGVLRALGVTRGQVFRLIMSEAIVLGFVGASFGVFLGAMLGEQLVLLVSRTISDHYFVVHVTDVSLSGPVFFKGLLAGVGATLIAAAIPAIEASSFAPRLALLRSVVEARSARFLPILTLSGLGLIALAILILSVSGSNLVAGLAAMFAIILGYAFCIPAGVKFCSRLMIPIAQKFGGTPARLAAAGIGASLSRTGVAIVALAIAVSATIGVSIMVESFRDSVGSWLESTLQSDVYVGVPRGSLDPQLLQDLVVAPGIAAHSTARRAWLESAGGRTRVFATQPAPGEVPGINLRGADAEIAWREFSDGDAVFVSDPYAYKNQVVAGDKIDLQTKSGSHSFLVAAVYQSYDSNDGVIMMERATYSRHFEDPGIDSIGLYLEPGVDPDIVMDRLREISTGRQALIMNSNARIRELSLGVFDRTFVITDVLYWLTVGIAIVGILGAMLALQLERAREFGILRAVGMTPRQLGSLVTGQSAMIGFLSGIAAIPLGVVMAVLLIEVINRRAFGWQMDITVTISALAAAMVLAITAAVVAGIYPAFRAARCQPALAMREE